MLFSIITPSFNQGRFIRDCIESVKLNAECGMRNAEIQIEHIVIDASSTDETVSILKEYSHLQWISEQDKGQTDAINKGFRRAAGDWVMWLNADDYLMPGALALVARFAARYTDAEVIYGDCDFVDESRQLIRRKPEFDFDANMLLFYGCYIPSTATFFHRRIHEAGLELDDTLKVCMDFEWFLRLQHGGFRFKHLPASLAGFRWHGENVSALNAVKRGKERFQIQRKYLDLQGRGFLAHRMLLNGLFYCYRAVRVLRRLSGEQKRERIAFAAEFGGSG